MLMSLFRKTVRRPGAVDSHTPFHTRCARCLRRAVRYGPPLFLLFTHVRCSTGNEESYRDPDFPHRHFVSAAWDTVLLIGGTDPNDTTLLQPRHLKIWEDRIAVLDQRNQSVRAFSRGGEWLWSLEQRGGGPGELKNAFRITPAPSGNLWVLDSDNRKVVELSPNGEVLRDIPIHHFPAGPTSLASLGNRVIFQTNTPDKGVIAADTHSLRIIETHPLPWPEPLDFRLNITTTLAASTGEQNTWVTAFEFGPGFIVHRGDSATVHRYIDPISFALKSGPRERAIGADTARFGARAVSIVGDEIFMLFGGRPVRMSHMEGEPTVLIDVYGMEGEYRRSYRLPSSSWSMDTDDGETFYVLTYADETYPVLLGLRPRRR